mmetsp:Transcript_16683/g.43220  ORF Transcript_16683/g.43220 Transcript_16683/m.43220 type:complete len:274 (+) Transcript_16683:162-983(+)
MVLLLTLGRRVLKAASATLLPHGKLRVFEAAAERIEAVVGRGPAFVRAREQLQSIISPLGERTATFVHRAAAAYAAASFAPMVAQMALTSFTTHSLGELTSQLLERIAESDDAHESLLAARPLDLGSVRTFGLLGLTMHGPLSYAWFTLADATMVRYGRGLGPRMQTAVLVAADQLAWGPAWVLTSCTVLRISAGESLHGIGSFAVGLCVQGLALWVPAHVVTYGFLVSPLSRLVWVGAVEIAWVCLLASAIRASSSGDTAAENGGTDLSPAA